jgi:shikimate dehydrogenase
MNSRRYALLGSPISGSKSPLIHHTSFVFNEINATYEAFEVLPEQLGEALKAFILEGYSGFNITIPHKEAVLAFVDELDPLAEHMGAVNTLVVRDGKIKGYNTDGLGLVESLAHHGLELQGLRVLILGAGGAAKGICHALAMAGVSHLDIHNRTFETAQALVLTLKMQYELSCEVFDLNKVDDLSGLDAVNRLKKECLSAYDLVINTTSVGMTPNTETLPIEPEMFSKETVFCDIVYKPHETLFLRRARAMGAKCIYGIEMLIFQALLSEQLWENCQIDLEQTKHELFETEGLFK